MKLSNGQKSRCKRFRKKYGSDNVMVDEDGTRQTRALPGMRDYVIIVCAVDRWTTRLFVLDGDGAIVVEAGADPVEGRG